MRFTHRLLAPGVVMLVLTGCVPENGPLPAPSKSPQATAPALKPSEAATTIAHAPVLPAAAPARPEVQSLIDAVEAAYQSGVTNYHAGKLQIAKADFDRAVDLMLNCNLNLHNEPQLHDEFDRVLDAVNTLEVEALKQGNGFAPKIEPAPVDIANDVTFPVDPTVKAQAIAQLKTTQSDLPLVINDPVAGYISYFSSPRGRGTMIHSLERAGRYHAMITAVLAEEGVPQDLIYQAVAESGFQPQAMNGRTGAGGMWQFMPFDSYGLARTGWYDERFDPEKATHAYARYIKTMYAQFGDWYLAMAAYDWGPGNVQKAVQRTGYADFWELYHRNALPQETKNYVPIIIASAIMAKNPQQYGLTLSPDPPLVLDTITTDYSVDLRLVADIVEAPVQEMSSLNPSLLRMSTPPDTPFALHLPAGTKALYEKRIAEVPVDKRNQWRFHKVIAGESVETIARDYHVTPAEIVFVNQLEAGDDLSATDSLIIPVPPAASSRSRQTLYRVQRGDTVVTVADRFNITVRQLRRWNHLGAAKLAPGRSLNVAEPALVTHATGNKRRSSASRKRGSKRSAARNVSTRKSSLMKQRTARKAGGSTAHRAKHSSP